MKQSYEMYTSVFLVAHLASFIRDLPGIADRGTRSKGTSQMIDLLRLLLFL